MAPLSLQDRFLQIQERIAAAAAKARRAPDQITLIAVTKSAAPEQVKTLVELGQRHLAESRVQQLQQRAAQIHEWLARQAGRGEKPLPPPEDIHWHMIGHLQRNKVKPVLQIVRTIHSVDSLRLAEEIQAGVAKSERIMQILLEVNVAGEGTKFGVAVGAAVHMAEQIDTMEGVSLVGLMGMAPYSEDPEQARPHFVRLREIFEEIRFRKIGGPGFRHLSMGMSGDYQVAIEEGATMVRIGTALFG
jgi:pyridoxal phosphate enzyme (YggS family)